MSNVVVMFEGRQKELTGFAQLLRPYRATLVWVAGLSLIGGLAEAGVLVLILQAAVLLSGPSAKTSISVGPLHVSNPPIAALLGAALAATCVRLVVQLSSAWGSARLTADIQRELRTATFGAYIDATWAVQAADREGNLQHLLGVEVERTTAAVLQLATGLTVGCSLLMLVAAAVVISPLAALVVVGLVVGLFFGLRPMTRLGRVWATTRSGEEVGVAQSLNELVRTAEEIRVHGVGGPEGRRLANEAESISRLVCRIQFVGLGITQVYQGVVLLLVVLALFAVHEAGGSSLASLGAIVLILLRSFAYSQQLQSTYHQLTASLPSVVRLQEQQALYRRNQVTVGSDRLPEIVAVALDSVTYSYGSGRPALEGVSFRVDRGEVIGVVGPSGAGKSTLVQVLLRLRNPDSGRFLVNGQAAERYNEADWTKLVSYLPQEPKLIAGTVADNIRFLRTGFSDEAVRTAARLANIDAEIEAWPAGYGTVIGQRVDGVSGGQRQRLCLARALLSSPQMLVLDEPTSALDAASERIIQETLESLQGSTTIFIVAHRLSTLTVCNRILVLNEGRVEDFDTSANLLARPGFYQRVANLMSADSLSGGPAD